MLQNLREHAQGWIAGVIVAILCLAFALWGIEYYIGGNQHQAVLAKVNGHEISQDQVDSVYKRLRQQLAATDFATFNQDQQQALKAQALEKLVNQNVLATAAEKANYHISMRQISSILTQIPSFQLNGQFSPALFQRVVTNFFPSEQAFLDDVKQSAIILQAKMGMTESAFVLPNELNQAISLMDQKRDVRYLTIPAAQFLKTATITDQAIANYYKSHQQSFMQAAQVKIEYIELAAKDFNAQVTVTEPEISQSYEENKAAYSTPEQWQIAQILINVPEHAEQNAIAAAQGKIDAIAQKLKQNQDFATLAIQYSDDKASSIKGGLLGWVDRSKLPAETIQAVSTLQPGQTSAPFRTAQGFAIVKLLGINSPVAKPLAAVHEQVANALRQQKVQQILSDKSDQLTNLTYTNPDTLKVAADTLKLPVQTSEFFTQQGAQSGVAADPKVVAVAFSDNVLKQRNNSDLIALDDQTALVMRVADYKPAALRPLAEVRPMIEDKLKAQAAKDAAQTLGKKILADLKQGQTIDDAAKKYQLSEQQKQNISREVTEIPAQILELAFSLPGATATHPALGGKSLTDGSYIVIAVTNVQNGDPKTADPQRVENVRKALSEQYGALDYYLYTTEKMQQAKIKFIQR